jgi:hypothetical protein
MMLGVLFVTFAITGAAENTPPQVTIETPSDGAELGMAVVVSGTATDTEGFNTSSLVEMRWDDWEWFTLPSNPGGGGTLLSYGEQVNLLWHAPGEHELTVRAFDGELYSEEVTIDVTLRDLPDLVILPSDILIDPPDGKDGDDAEVVVVVRNQGGEKVSDVEVVLRKGDKEIDRVTISKLPASGSRTLRFPIELREGNLTLRASANAMGAIQEKSQANNFAEVSFRIEEEERVATKIQQLTLAVAVAAIFLLLVSWGFQNPK